jgi:hypothetical protein
VQQAREAARRSQCANNLKQIGLALHNYVDAHGCFPNSFGSKGPYAWSANDGSISWRALVLPYFEQDGRWNAHNFGRSLDAPENTTAVTTVFASFLCPSDGKNGNGRMNTQAGPGAATSAPSFVSVANYAGSFGDNRTADTLQNPNPFDRYYGHPRVGGVARCSDDGGTSGYAIPWWGTEGTLRGFFDYKGTSIVKIKQVTDGLSKTIVTGEVLPWQNWDSQFWTYTGSTASTVIPINWYTGVGFSEGSGSISSCGVDAGAAGNINCRGNYVAKGFKSSHAGGCYLGMADGSVQFLTENINMCVYAAMGSKAGGDDLGQ